MNERRTAEGYVNVTGGRIWYQIIGNADAIPLLILHGGPGVPHDYLEPLAALADERPVIFYDQLGCGKSDQPDDVSLWRIERFVEELAQVREALGLYQMHLLGQSWGTMLAVDYALTQPSGLTSLILADPAISMPRWAQDAQRLRATLPADVQAVLAQHEAAGTTTSDEYRAAAREYYKRFVCRLDPWPEFILRAKLALPVYQTMWGDSEFSPNGNLKDYERTDRLHEINVPTLFLCGRYDEATPEATADYHSRMPQSEMLICEQSSHMPHAEESERYLQVVRDFLRRAGPG